MPPAKPDSRFSAGSDRRRTPRFQCNGQAKIIILPSNGLFLPGQVRDLSVGGCRIDTPSALVRGAQTELVIQVNSSAFRAIGEVRAAAGASGICVEFVRLSRGGRDMLAQLVADLAQLQVKAGARRNALLEADPETVRESLRRGGLEPLLILDRYPIFRAVTTVEPASGTSESAEQRSPLDIESADADLEVEPGNLLDLFI